MFDRPNCHRSGAVHRRGFYMTRLIDRERIKISAEVVSLSGVFGGGRKREIVFEVSITLDESELTEEMVGSIYTATLQKEKGKKP